MWPDGLSASNLCRQHDDRSFDGSAFKWFPRRRVQAHQAALIIICASRMSLDAMAVVEEYILTVKAEVCRLIRAENADI